VQFVAEDLAMVRQDTLPNGVRIVTEHIPHVESVSIGVWVLTGASDERPGQEGITHLTEHMAFKGTERRTGREMAELIDGVGGQINGFTEREYTCYHASVLSDHLPTAADVLFDMVLHSKFDPDEVSREKEVVVQEIKKYEDTPEEWVNDLFVRTVWPNHPLGNTLLGKEETVRATAPEDLHRFVAERYTADRLVVAAAGRLDHAKLVAQAAEALPEAPTAGPSDAETEPSLEAGERHITRATEQVHFVLGTRGYSYTAEERYTLSVLDAVVGGSPSSRLWQEVREKRGLVYQIGSYAMAFRRAGLFAVTGGTAPGNFGTVRDVIYDELARLRDASVKEDELRRAQEQIKGGLALARESTGYRVHRLAMGVIYSGRVIPYSEIRARIEAVVEEDVSRMARVLFREGGSGLVAVGPF